MKANGSTIKPVVMVSIHTPMALNMKASGKMISKTEKESKPGQMENIMKVSTNMEPKAAMACLNS